MKILFFLLICFQGFAQVIVGSDVFFQDGFATTLLNKKKVGLITNHTAINHNYVTTFDLFKQYFQKHQGELVALFAPEHGFYGEGYADEKLYHTTVEGMPVYSLHGEVKRPTQEMLQNVDVLFFDIQDIGCRSYTYTTTLFYCMEEAAKKGIQFVVFDRPNPQGGLVVDGPMLHPDQRSFFGYIDVPYCHGMTIGELSNYFNKEYNIGCDLIVIPMKGWKRNMPFTETKLPWVPTSPQIPEDDTPLYYSATGVIGHLSLTSIGIGYTLPFKVIGAPWIDGELLASTLNQQNLPGVVFTPYRYKPFFGKFKMLSCKGVKINIKEPNLFLPMTTQYTIMGVIKSMYPEKFQEAMRNFFQATKYKTKVFHQLNGNDEYLKTISEEKYFAWKFREDFNKQRQAFSKKRTRYLNKSYE